MAGTFALDLTRLCKKAEIDMVTAVRRLAFTAFYKVAIKTPVDTGRAKANWNVSVGKADTTTDVNATDKTGQATVAKITAVTQSWSGKGSIFLCNSLPYIIPLEYGHSQQAANGMVRVTVEEMQNWANSQGAINGND